MSVGARLAFPAMLTGSAALAFGPWLVRVADVAPVASAFWRLALAVVPLTVLAAAARRGTGTHQDAAIGGNATSNPEISASTRLDMTTLIAIALAGVFFAVDLALWHLGIARTTLANSTLMANSAAFILPVYGFVVARAWPGRTAVIALLCASAGIGLLLGRSAELAAAHLTGDLLCIAAGAFYAAYFVAVERVRARVSPLTLLALATLAGAVALLPLALALALTGTSVGGSLLRAATSSTLTGTLANGATHATSSAFWPRHWAPLILLALGSQVVGQGLIVFAVGYLPPLVIGLTLLIQPAISATIGALRFGEGVGPVEVIGMALVATALVLVRLPSKQ